MTDQLTPAPAKSASADAFERRIFRDFQEWVVEVLLFLAAASSIGITTAIMVLLFTESWGFFQEVSLVEFLTATEWSALFDDPVYGVLPLVSGTFTTSFVALAVAMPMGTIAAVYLSEFAPGRVREIVKPCLEVLAGIPTVVFGYFALLVVTPVLQKIYNPFGQWLLERFPDIPYEWTEVPGFNMLSAGMVMGLMITPLISSISEDAMRAVPVELREGSYAAGATRFQTAWKVVFPAAISGVSASYILGISRAVGETMIVTVAAGLQPVLSFNPLNSAATMTSYIAQVSQGDLPHGTIAYQAIFAVGLTLVLITLVLNIVGFLLSRHIREEY